MKINYIALSGLMIFGYGHSLFAESLSGIWSYDSLSASAASGSVSNSAPTTFSLATSSVPTLESSDASRNISLFGKKLSALYFEDEKGNRYSLSSQDIDMINKLNRDFHVRFGKGKTTTSKRVIFFVSSSEYGHFMFVTKAEAPSSYPVKLYINGTLRAYINGAYDDGNILGPLVFILQK